VSIFMVFCDDDSVPAMFSPVPAPIYRPWMGCAAAMAGRQQEQAGQWQLPQHRHVSD
jgi:hypothetical protein